MWIVARIIGLIIVFPVIIQGGVLFSLSYLDLLQGLLLILYAALLESMWGATLGKQIMNLKVTTMDGRLPTLDRTLIRNASKIYGLLHLIDLLVGMATIGDPHQKLSDRYAGTTVVSTIQRTMILPASSTSPPPP
jgi:uncharacterized RDD family membrane protein YckC